jgi:multiple sugar transport system permease protein
MVGGVTRTRAYLKRHRNERLVALSFLAPNLIGFIVLTVLPILATVYISLTEWNLLKPPQWLGFDNYLKIFVSKRFLQTLGNTAYYTIASVPVGIILAVFLAVLMNGPRKKLNTFFRIVYYLPVISSTVAVALIWKFLYADDIGLISYFFSSVGLAAPKFLTSTQWSMTSVVIMSVWKGLGYNIILVLAGLQGIAPTYYEAAEIDGANGWDRFWRVTLPMLTPTLFFMTIMSIINSFQVFDQTKILTDGGPGFSSTSIVYYIYSLGFVNMKFGAACTIAVVLFALILLLSMIQWALQKRWVNYDA